MTDRTKAAELTIEARELQMISDRDLGKKMVEEEQLRYFVEAYERTTGDRLIVHRSETPDFAGRRSDGSKVGVELTEVRRDPDTAFADSVFNRRDSMDSSDALNRVYELVEKKAATFTKKAKAIMRRTVLVLQLTDCPLADLRLMLDASLHEDFASYRFAEIWLADYTDLDAYGDVELFGLSPRKWWGFHPRPDPGRKPYG